MNFELSQLGLEVLVCLEVLVLERSFTLEQPQRHFWEANDGHGPSFGVLYQLFTLFFQRFYQPCVEDISFAMLPCL